MVGKDFGGGHVRDFGAIEFSFIAFGDPDAWDIGEEGGFFDVGDAEDVEVFGFFADEEMFVFEGAFGDGDLLDHDSVVAFGETVVEAEVDAGEGSTEVVVKGLTDVYELAVKFFGVDGVLDGSGNIEHEGDGDGEGFFDGLFFALDGFFFYVAFKGERLGASFGFFSYTEGES